MHSEQFIRVINPASWVVGFYLLWFIFPQIAGLFNDLHILGFEQQHIWNRYYAYAHAQFYCILFLCGLNVSQFLTIRSRAVTRISKTKYRINEILKHYEKSKIIFYFFLFMGLCGSLYIASQNLGNLEGFRSQIVKTPVGKLATSLQFFGAFAVSCISVCLFLKKKYALLVALILFYSGISIFTGARGRLLWPFAITIVYLVAIKGGRFQIRYVIYAIVGILFLLSLDPLVKYFKYGEISVNDFSSFVSPLIYKRNFDGFPNFAFVLYHDNIDPSLKYLVIGAREEFMTTYFPVIWEKGVGWGVTIPGLIYLSSSNAYVFFLISIIYGLTITVLNRLLIGNRNILLTWSYLFAMPWYCALGGNFVESLDKMVVAASAPIFLLMYESIRKVNFS